MLNMLINGFICISLFRFIIDIIKLPYTDCSEKRQDFGHYIVLQLCVIISVAIVSIIVGFILSLFS